jgi:hypothetical protein
MFRIFCRVSVCLVKLPEDGEKAISGILLSGLAIFSITLVHQSLNRSIITLL